MSRVIRYLSYPFTAISIQPWCWLDLIIITPRSDRLAILADLFSSAERSAQNLNPFCQFLLNVIRKSCLCRVILPFSLLLKVWLGHFCLDYQKEAIVFYLKKRIIEVLCKTLFSFENFFFANVGQTNKKRIFKNENKAHNVLSPLRGRAN